MRNGLIGLVGTVMVSSTLAFNGCRSSSKGDVEGGGGTAGGASNGGSSSGGANSGGSSTGLGGSSSGGGGPIHCSDANACGGDLVGTWAVESSCLAVRGELDVSMIGMACSSVPVTGSLEVAGTWIANPDGSYTDETNTRGTETFTLDASCLVISSTPVTCAGAANVMTALGFASTSCTPNASGGCNCSAVVNQAGGIGLVSVWASSSGRYSSSGNSLKTDDIATYSYCAAGNALTLMPESTKPTMTGTVVLKKSGTTGVGGATGSGGQSGLGGITGSGGGNAKGGAPGSGGSSNVGGSGGSSSVGGAVGAGGKATTGGTTSSSGGTIGTGGTLSTGGTGSSTGPCDIYAGANTPCVAAHSTVRALYGAYSGKLYQVRRSDNTTKDILTLAPGGVADTAPQDTFCSGSTCVITVLYDQSGKGNDMWYQGSAQVPASTSSTPAKATTESLNVSGHKVYSLYINPNNCYWHDGSRSGMATGAQPEGMYMVTSGKHANAGCCFDYGNSETTRSADGAGTMDAINFSTTSAWGSGAGAGPWIMADLEWGLFAGNPADNPNSPTQTSTYVTAVLKNNGTTEFALRGGDATTGNLSTYYKGALPGGWSPMKKQGAITLGCGGDCCKPGGGANASAGTFYEGAIVSGYPTDATENAVQANIVSASYGK